MKDTCEATVVSVSGEKARVKVAMPAECSGCASKSNCHAGSGHSRELTVINEIGAKTGDNVIFEVAPGKFVLSATLIWILPLISMFVGYFVAERYSSGFWPILSAFAFLAVAFGILKVIDNAVSGGRTFYPVISKIVRPSGR